MCANTRLFYLSPNMSRPLLSCSTSPPCPDSHQNIDPSCHRGALQNPQNAPLCFYFSYLSGMRHFPSLFNPFGYSKPDQTSFLDVTSLLSHDNLFTPKKIFKITFVFLISPVKELYRLFKIYKFQLEKNINKAPFSTFSIFSPQAIQAAPPPSASIPGTAGNHFETT